MTVEAKLGIRPEAIAEFCRRHRIQELSFFGSVLRDDFRPDSDVDVLVDFDAQATPSLFDFIEIEEELSRLVGRPIDLIGKSGLQNPFRRHEILRTRQVIFAA
jgi:predicted nucleotidyltransferase